MIIPALPSATERNRITVTDNIDAGVPAARSISAAPHFLSTALLPTTTVVRADLEYGGMHQ
jgi:hypothetical protein